MDYLTPNIQKLKDYNEKKLFEEGDLIKETHNDSMTQQKNYFNHMRNTEYSEINNDINLGKYGLFFYSDKK